MKSSFKLLGTAFTAYIVFTIITIISLRNSIALNWEQSDAILTAHTHYSESDSIQFEVPPPQFKWYDVTLGLNTRLPKNEWNNSNHIFSDLGLVLVSVYPTTLSRFYLSHPEATFSKDMWKRFLPNKQDMNVKSFFRRTIGTLSYSFALDSLVWPNQGKHWRPNIKISIQKQAVLPEEDIVRLPEDTTTVSGKYTFRYKRFYQIGPSGIYCSSHVESEKLIHFILCYWSKGLWKTEISIPFPVINDCMERNLQLRDQMRDRLFQYYKELNRKYSNSS